MLAVILTIVYVALFLYFFAIWARFILDLVMAFSRGWKPRGFMLVLAEGVYTITDPPIRLTRRLVGPVRIGGMSLDFAISIVMLVVLVLLYIVSAARAAAGSL